jgi:hypothetical protein
VNVAYATSDGAAVAPDDYGVTNGQLTFAPGETSKTVDVPVKGDTAAELTESFAFDLGSPVHADIADGHGEGEITDNDPDPSFSIGDVSVSEGDAGTTTATFTVSLSAVTFKTATVQYFTMDGSAVAPGDYAIQSGTLTFVPGETTQQVTVDVAGDTSSEGDEYFTVELSDAANASIAPGGGTGTITDDDALPTSASVTVKKSRTRIAANGVLLNAEVGMKLTIQLQRKKGSKYVKGVSRTASVKSVTGPNVDGQMEGPFSTKFKLPSKGSYRFVVTYAGDVNHLPCTATRKFKL